MQTFFLLLSGVALCVAVVYALRSKSRNRYAAFGEYPAYGVRQSLLNQQEIAYYKVLARAIGEHYVAFPKVRLSDILEHPGQHPQFRAHWVRVQRRCVDLLVCSLNLTPVLAVKFGPDVRRRGVKRDVLDDALEAAGLPLLRVKPADHYKLEEVLYRFKFAMAASDAESEDVETISTLVEPVDARAVDSSIVSLRDRFLTTRLGSMWSGSGLYKIRRWTSDLWVAARRQH